MNEDGDSNDDANAHNGPYEAKDVDLERSDDKRNATSNPLRESDVATRGRFFRFLDKAFAKGVEARGIERVPEDERDGKHTIGLLLFWWSVNLVVSTVTIGVSVISYSSY